MPHKSQEEKEATRITKMLGPIIFIWLKMPMPMRYALMIGSGISAGGPAGNFIGGNRQMARLDSIYVHVCNIEADNKMIHAVINRMDGGPEAIKKYLEDMQRQKEIEELWRHSATIGVPAPLVAGKGELR